MLDSHGLQSDSANLSPQAFRFPLSLASLIHHNVERQLENIIVKSMGMSGGMTASALILSCSVSLKSKNFRGLKQRRGLPRWTWHSLAMSLAFLSGTLVWQSS